VALQEPHWELLEEEVRATIRNESLIAYLLGIPFDKEIEIYPSPHPLNGIRVAPLDQKARKESGILLLAPREDMTTEEGACL